MYRHALVCVDLRGRKAAGLLQRAAQMLDRTGRISVVNVIEVGAFEDESETVASLLEAEHGTRATHLERLCREAGLAGAERTVLVGKAPAQIAAHAAQLGCDLVVLGEHEDTAPRAWLGSTTDAVLPRLRCDALVVGEGPRR